MSNTMGISSLTYYLKYFFLFLKKRYYTPLQPAFYPFSYNQTMAAASNLELMNEHEELQEDLEPNIAQEPIQGIFGGFFST